MWNGTSCFRFHDSGCSLVGPDCAKGAPDEATCKSAHAQCKSAPSIATSTSASASTAPEPPMGGMKLGVKPASCKPQKCAGKGNCDAFFEPGWMWNGVTCFMFTTSGCGLVGPDCNTLAKDPTTCTLAHAHCPRP